MHRKCIRVSMREDLHQYVKSQASVDDLTMAAWVRQVISKDRRNKGIVPSNQMKLPVLD